MDQDLHRTDYSSSIDRRNGGAVFQSPREGITHEHATLMNLGMRLWILLAS